MSGAHTAGRREIAPDARKRPSAPSAGARQGNHTPGAGNAPGAVVDGNPAKYLKKSTRQLLKRAECAAHGIEAAGSFLVASVKAMRAAERNCRQRRISKAEREAEYLRQFSEIYCVLNDHADAMVAFLGEFWLAERFAGIREELRKREVAERKAALIAELEADDASAAAKRR